MKMVVEGSFYYLKNNSFHHKKETWKAYELTTSLVGIETS